MKNDISLMLL